MKPTRDPDQHRPRADRRPGGARRRADLGRDLGRRARRHRSRAASAGDPLLDRAEPDRRAAHRLGHPSRARADGRARGRQPARRARRPADAPSRSARVVRRAPRGRRHRHELDAAVPRRGRTRPSSTELERRTVVTRLGAGVDADGRLREDAMASACTRRSTSTAPDRRATVRTARRGADERGPDAANGAEFAAAVGEPLRARAAHPDRGRGGAAHVPRRDQRARPDPTGRRRW